jgi:tetratricopeptide (TPR) repeat protein
MFGRGYLWAEDVSINDWLQLETLRMEIPDLSFPFDAGGGIDRFQQTRCQVREIELSIRESAFETLLRRATDSIGDFEQLSVRFLEGAIHMALRLRAFGADTYLSMRAGVLPPEPPRSDELHVSLYDYRPLGPLPYPARVLAYQLLTGILDRPTFSSVGRGEAFQLGVAGDLVSFRPVKLLFAELFPRYGWKLPNLAGVTVDDVEIRSGRLTFRASSREGDWEGRETDPPEATPDPPEEKRRALAAYEAKDLFAPADEALFQGDVAAALDRLAAFRDRFGLSNHLVGRLLDCLLADPTTRHVAEARSICRDLETYDDPPLSLDLARVSMARLSRDEDDIEGAYRRLSERLRERDDTRDWVLVELTLARLVERDDPEEAARRLREVLEAAPRHRTVLENLRDLYERLGERDRLEDVLRRLAGIYTARGPLLETYRDLGRHLMNREGELAEARHYLQQALELDSDDRETLVALGECYALGDQPLRAIKAFGAASRRAEATGDRERARQLHVRAAELWYDALGESDQALLSMRRALPDERVRPDLEGGRAVRRRHADRLAYMARLCEASGRSEEALAHWSDLVSFVDHVLGAEERSSPDVDPTPLEGHLLRAHRRLAALYESRQRYEAAAHQWERILAIEPDARDAIDYLRNHYRNTGRPKRLLELLEQQLERTDRAERASRLHRDVADIHEALGRPELADDHRDEAEQLEPSTGPDPDGETSIPSQGSSDDEGTRRLPSTFESDDAPETAPSVPAPGELEPDPSSTDESHAPDETHPPADETRPPADETHPPSGDDEAAPHRETPHPSLGQSPSAAIDPEEATADELDASLDDELDEEATGFALGEALESALDVSDELLTPDDEHSEPDDESPDVIERLESARRDGTPEDRADVMRDAIALYERDASSVPLSESEYLQLNRDLGELLYFELEREEEAKGYLETLRRDDPEGLGSDQTVLTILESVYENHGTAQERIDLLETRLSRAETDEMSTTYRLLLAQLHWEERDDRNAAEAHLEEALEIDPDHEGAHRLMAEMARDAGEPERTTRHLEALLDVAESGLDAVEIERELAELLLHQLDRPDEAIDHYRQVLRDAPGDSQALEGLEACQASLGDWTGYLESLGRELGLLVGEPDGLDVDDMAAIGTEDVGEGGWVPASQILGDAADILASKLDRPEQAQQLLRTAHQLWPEHAEALERRIELDRQLDDDAALASDLEAYANCLLDSAARIDALVESATLHYESLDDPETARSLVAESLRMLDDSIEPPETLVELRRALFPSEDDEDA